MSRSALQKNVTKVPPPVPPNGMMPTQGINVPPTTAYPPQYFMYQQQQMAAMHYGMQMQQAYTPIPLTGDEEDNEDPTAVKKNALPQTNSSNFNINNLLFNNIMENEYFKALFQLRTYHEVIDEIYRSVQHVEPWQTGTTRYPSSAFCLLVKFLLMKLTVKQMNGLLTTSDCTYVRSIGFLYLRYTCPPNDLYKWYEPYLEDEEEFSPSADKSIKTTVGAYCTKLLVEMQYFGTTLPRIPVPIERKIKVFLLLLEEKKKRRKNNLRVLDKGFFEVGKKVRAIYSDEQNEPAWYDAVIDSIDEDAEEEGKHRFWVTFTEYGNSECVDLGDIETPEEKEDRRNDRRRGDSRDRKRRRSDSRERRRSRSRERDRRSSSKDKKDSGDLLQKVLQSEREATVAIGRNYGQRPTSYKGSLSLKVDRYTVRRKSPSPVGRRPRSRSRSPRRRGERERERGRDREKDFSRPVTIIEQEKLKLQKMKLLKERYGDASSSGK